MTSRSTVYLSLGSNLGPRLTNLRTVAAALNEVDGLEIETVSPVYESEAHTRRSDETMPDFLNMVARVKTTHSPHELLDVCLRIEGAKGRIREEGTWLPRSIDIDILVFADQVIDSELLKVPHPRMAERRFVLLPFADIDPSAWVPEPFSSTIAELLRDCPDRLGIRRRYPAHAVFGGEAVSNATR